MNRLLVLFLCACPVAIHPRPQADPALPASSSVASAPLVVFLLRHAEADSSDPSDRDPGLSSAGLERAQELARLLGRSGVTHLYSSEYERTRATLAPLAEALGREIEVQSARDANAQVAALRALPPGSVAVVCGHSNTVPDLVERLGAKLSDLVASRGQPARLEHDSHDRLPVLMLDPAAVAAPFMLELTYGD